jgi:hypothetical protein
MPSSTDENAAIVEGVRQVFAPLLERLTPETEPAIVFAPVPEDSPEAEHE